MTTPYRTRRTVKPPQMDPAREIPRALLLEILEDAHWAPTHGLTQPWRFHVFAGAARQRLSDGLTELYDRETPEAARQAEKREKLRTAPLSATVAIAVVARAEPLGKIPEVEEIAATACAVQNLMLSAHERGIGSFWATPPAACAASFVEWLGLGADHRALGIVYLGYPLPGVSPISSRVPLAERIVFR